MKNELMLIDEIDKKLQQPRKEIVFPLSPTHRKELRQLRNINIGNLKNRMNTIKRLKKEEYLNKYKKQIEKELENQNEKCVKLNNDWKEKIKQLKLIINDRIKLEEKMNLVHVKKETGYGNICNLEKNFDIKRIFIYKKHEASMSIADEEFENKYGSSFKIVSDKINDIETKYEEAINFGDLEIVKKLYYIMKNVDVLFEKIDKLQV